MFKIKKINFSSIICLSIFLVFSYTNVYALTTYTIDASVNDEKFVINGETFEAKTYCFNMDEGDQVAFLEGSPFGACVSATIYNTRTKMNCELWCE